MDEPSPPEVSFEHLDRSDSLRKTYHCLWPHLVKEGRVLQSDLAVKIVDEQDRYSETSLKDAILPQIADVLVKENVIKVDTAEDRRKQKDQYVEWILP